jgi:hypothetical protein
MLSPQQITELAIGTAEWDIFWTGKISSSQVSCITSKEEIADGGLNYLLFKAMERFCNVKKTTVKEEINEEDDYEWGIKYEPEALARYCEIMNCGNLLRHKIVESKDKNSATIPDGLILHPHEDEFVSVTVEAKCPKTYHRFYRGLNCKTPEDIKQFDRAHYWQTIDQMLVCSAYTGYIIYYHPHFPEPVNYNIVSFNRTDLLDDFLFLDLRKKEAAVIIQDYVLSVSDIQNSREMK